MKPKRKDELEEGFDRLEAETPGWVSRCIRWLRDPKARPFRLPLGILMIVASFFWFLPILGLWMLPFGLLLVAQDVPVMRRPAGRTVIWMEDRWQDILRWWARRRQKG